MSYAIGTNPENLHISNNLDGKTYFHWRNSKNEFCQENCNSNDWFNLCFDLGKFEENSKVDPEEGYTNGCISVREVKYNLNTHSVIDFNDQVENYTFLIDLTVKDSHIYVHESTWNSLVSSVQWRNRNRKITWLMITLYDFLDWIERLFK